jgi:hypothetical protein
MNPYLKRAIIIWLATAIIGISYAAYGQEWNHNCVANAIRDCWTYELRTGNPCLIAVSNIKDGVDHAQALGMTDKAEWIYLTTHNSDGQLREWEKHFQAEPYRYLTLNQFIEEQKTIRKSALLNRRK